LIPQAEELTDCRIDHYQTPGEVHVSVFAKKADPGRSTVRIEQEQVSRSHPALASGGVVHTRAHAQLHLDILLPGSKRFRRSIDLFGPVDSTASSFKFFGTKVGPTFHIECSH
jgi:hypothetical protein